MLNRAEGHSAAGKVRSIETSNDMKSRTGDLPACNRVPQPIILPDCNRVPQPIILSDCNRVPQPIILPDCNRVPQPIILPACNSASTNYTSGL
jgi:hypothetical protein